MLLRAGNAENWREEMLRDTEEAIAVFTAAGDHTGLARARVLQGYVHGVACRFADAAAAVARASDDAALAGDPRLQTRSATAYAAAAFYGPTPVDEAAARCNEILPRVAGDRHAAATVQSLLASLEAMRRNFDDARELVAASSAMLAELGLEVAAAQARIQAARVETLAGDPAAAERELRASYAALEQLGERYLLSTVAGHLGQALYAQRRYDEADELAERSRSLAAEDDVGAQAVWRSVRAKVLAQRGEHAEAVLLADEARERLSATDGVMMQVEALLDLAEVQERAGHDAEAQAAVREAARLAELKGDAVAAESARERLERIAPAAPRPS